MPLANDLAYEMHVLNKFSLDTTLAGIKIHKDAEPAVAQAASRLFDKGLITQADGGYLTELGRQCAEHLQLAVRILQQPES